MKYLTIETVNVWPKPTDYAASAREKRGQAANCMTI